VALSRYLLLPSQNTNQSFIPRLMCFIDVNEERNANTGKAVSGGSITRPGLEHESSSSSSVNTPPPLPEKPEKVISEEDYEPVSMYTPTSDDD
jgi:hypothetical protein